MKESGKQIVIVIIIIAVSLSTSGIIPQSQLITLFLIPILIGNGFIAYLVWHYANKKNVALGKQYYGLQNDITLLINAHKDEILERKDLEAKLTGTVSSLETITSYGVFYIDGTTGLLEKVNPQFEAMLGWDVKSWNAFMVTVPRDQRARAAVERLFDVESRERVISSVLRRFEGSTHEAEYHEIGMLTRKGKVIDVTIHIRPVRENGRPFLQGFIADNTSYKDMLQTIRELNDVVNVMVSDFSRRHNEVDSINELVELLTQMRVEIYDAAKRKEGS